MKTSETENSAESNVWTRIYVICKPVIDLSRSRKSSFINSFLITLTRFTKTLKIVWTFLHGLCVVNSISKTGDKICTDTQQRKSRIDFVWHNVWCPIKCLHSKHINCTVGNWLVVLQNCTQIKSIALSIVPFKSSSLFAVSYKNNFLTSSKIHWQFDFNNISSAI